jgi:hypothetical protein
MSIRSSSDATNSRSTHHICVTPARNEAWIIEPFLKAARFWAGHVIVADQASTDQTVLKARSIPGVEVIHNDHPGYDEAHRQRLLLGQARKLSGRRVILALDCDEVLSANCLASPEWKLINEAAPGTVLRFRWVNVLPGFKDAWIPGELIACGFVDDGSDHTGSRIHSRRIPWPDGAPVLDLQEIVVLHFQYVVWERMESKHRWYQAWECVNHPQKRPLEIFRQYNHMHGSWDQSEMQAVKPEWLAGYETAGVDFRSLASEPVTWWDREVFQMLCQHGPAHFRRLAIWDKDWNALRALVGGSSVDVTDPRSWWEKTVHRILSATQQHRANWGVRGFEKFLRATGW